MCEANAYLIDGDKNKLLMEAVDTVEPEDDGAGRGGRHRGCARCGPGTPGVKWRKRAEPFRS